MSMLFLRVGRYNLYLRTIITVLLLFVAGAFLLGAHFLLFYPVHDAQAVVDSIDVGNTTTTTGATTVQTGDTVTVNVTNSAANSNSGAVETSTADTIKSVTTDTTGFFITLTETDVDTGIFSGTFTVGATTDAAASPKRIGALNTEGIEITADLDGDDSPDTSYNLTVDDDAPSVSDTTFPGGDTSVPVDGFMAAIFNDNIASGSVSTTSVKLQTNDGNVSGGSPTGSNLCVNATVNSNNPTDVICDHLQDGSPMAADTWHTLTVTTTVTDKAGNALASNFTREFKTSSFSGGTDFSFPPHVESSFPWNGEIFPSNGKILVKVESMGDLSSTTMSTSGSGSIVSPSNVTLFEVDSAGATTGSNLLGCDNSQADAGSDDCNLFWDSSANILTITPGKIAPAGTSDSTSGSAVTEGKSYLLEFTSNVTNTDSRNLEYHSIFFTVGSADSTAPSAAGSWPDDGITSVDRAQFDLSVSFDEFLDPSSVATSSVKLYTDNGNGTFSAGEETEVTDVERRYDGGGRMIHIWPKSLLASGTKHWTRIVSGGSGVTDATGNQLTADIVRSFTTGSLINGANPDTTKPKIDWVEADNFEVRVFFNEPMKFGGGTNAADNTNNYKLEVPAGTQINLDDKFIEYIAHMRMARINGLSIPPGDTFKLTAKTAIQDLSGNAMDTSGTPAANVGQGTVADATNFTGQGATFNYDQNSTLPVEIFPMNAMAGATSQYGVEFIVQQQIPASGKIKIGFPSGYSFVADGGSTECQDVLASPSNDDINGPGAGTVTFTASCDSTAKSITLTTSGGSLAVGDFVYLQLQGITNPTSSSDPFAGGVNSTIKTFDDSSVLLENLNAQPFYIAPKGSRQIMGTVFNDNGNGGGTAGDKVQNGSEPGIDGARVCLGGPIGFDCKDTAGGGVFKFNDLADGWYHVDMPPLQSGSFVGGPFFRDLNISGSDASADFALQSSDRAIDVSISGGPASRKVDIFAFNPFNAETGGHVVRETTLDGNGDTSSAVSLPVTDGEWEVGVGPAMPKDPMAPPPPPDFDFMPPRPQQMTVSGAGTYALSFTLQKTNRTVKGKVVDGSGNAISNAWIGARPVSRNADRGMGGSTTSKTDGTFSLKVIDGTYLLDAGLEGTRPSSPVEVTVQSDTGNSGTDSNSTADIYSKGTLIVNDGDGDSDDLLLKIAKGARNITGRVLDGSNSPIQYAHVSAEEVDSSGNPIGGWTDSSTDSSGTYTLSVDDGTWRVRGWAPGFGELSAITVTVSGNDITGKDLTIDNTALGTISGTVKVAGSGVGGAMVTAYGASGGNDTISNSDGSYSLKVPAGTGYTVEGFIPNKGPLSPTTGVSVTAGSTTTVNLSLQASGTIEVTITGINDAFVDARDSNGEGHGTSFSNNGVYTLRLPTTTVSTGITYTVEAHNPKYGLVGSKSVTLKPSHTDASPLSVSLSAPTLHSVSGTINSSTANCKDEASVFLVDRANSRNAVTTTNSSGAYSISVPAGDYFVSAAKPGCIDNANPTSHSITGDKANVDRMLEKGGQTVSGQVLLSGSNTKIPGRVKADDGNGKVMVENIDTSQTGSNNNYSIALTTGTWTIQAFVDGYKSEEASVTVTSGSNVTQDLTLSAISGYTRKERKSADITPGRGGIIKDTNIDSNFEVNFPAGSLGTSTSQSGSVSTKLKTDAVSTSQTNIVADKAYEVTPKDSSGQAIHDLQSDKAKPIITIPYDESEVSAAGFAESEITLSVWADEKQQWEAIPTRIDKDNNLAIGTISHFSDIALGGATDPSAPATPTGVSASADSSSAITISWDQMSGATSYNVFRDNAADGPNSFPRLGSEPTVSSGSTTNYTDSGLSPCTTYWYKASSKNTNGESAASDPAVSAQTTGCGGGGGGGGGGGASVTPSPSGSISIASGATSVATRNVTLSISFSNATEMKISNTLDFSGISWENAVTTKEWTLPEGDEIKTVYIIFRNASGDESVIISDSITLETAVGDGEEIAEEEEESAPIAFQDGELIRAENSSKVFIIKNGKKRWVPTQKAFNANRFDWKNVKVVTSSEAAGVQEITLMREKGGERVYVVKSGVKTHIPNPDVFVKSGFLWENVVEVTSEDMAGFPESNLLRAEGDEKVYVLEKGMKRWVPTIEVFNAYNFDWNKVITVTDKERDAYPSAELIRETGGAKVFKLEAGQRRWIETADAFNEKGFDWADVVDVAAEEIQHWPEGETIK